MSHPACLMGFPRHHFRICQVAPSPLRGDFNDIAYRSFRIANPQLCGVASFKLCQLFLETREEGEEKKTSHLNARKKNAGRMNARADKYPGKYIQ